MRPGILAFRSISYMDVEDNVQDFLGTIGGKRIYLYVEIITGAPTMHFGVIDVYGNRRTLKTILFPEH